MADPQAADYFWAVSTFRHPMDVRDFFSEVSEPGIAANPTHAHLDEIIRRYDGNPARRYASELIDANDDQFCYFFFVRAFGGGILESWQLVELFHKLNGGPTGSYAGVRWPEFADLNAGWGSWRGVGHFAPSHPLREEAIFRFFASESARDRVEGIFRKLTVLCESDDQDGIVWQAAAFAAPQVGPMPSAVQEAPDRRSRANPNGQASCHAANAVGYRLRMHYDQLGRHAEDQPGLELSDERYRLDAELEAFLVKTLRALLASTDAVGAAAAAACDTYRAVNSEDFGPPLEDQIRALILRGADATPLDDESLRGSSLQVAWAITANFKNLPDKLHELLLTLCDDKDEWIRLRCREAVVDYYGPLNDIAAEDTERFGAYKERLNRVLEAAADDPSPLVRRGIAGSFQVNIEDMKFSQTKKAPEVLFELANKHPTDLDTIEWVCWTSGDRLESLLNLAKRGTLDAFRRWTFHPNARVRRWSAVALADGKAILNSPAAPEELTYFLARLADDPDENVCNAAAVVFSGGDEE